MQNVLKYYLILLLATGCATQKRCFERFPVDTVTTVIVRDSLVIRDTTLYIHIPGDTVRVQDTIKIPCPPPPPSYIPDTVIAETKYARALAWLDFPRISLTLIQKPINLEWRLDSVIRKEYYWREMYELAVKEKKVIPPLYRVSFWLLTGIILTFFLLILVAVIRR